MMRSLSAKELAPVLRAHDVHSLLDAGCGSGALLRDFIETCGEAFALHGLDVDDSRLPPFFDSVRKADLFHEGSMVRAEDFPGDYDAITCVDALSDLSEPNIALTLANLRAHARRICYLSIALSEEDDNPLVVGESGPVTIRPPKWWLQQFAQAGFKLLDNRLVRDKSGNDRWLHVFLDPQHGQPQKRQTKAGTAAQPRTLSPKQALKAAMQAHAGNRLKEAAALYQGVLKANPKDPDGLHGMGMISVEHGDLDEGERLIRAAIEIQGRKPSYHSNLGHLLALKGAPEEAVRAHQKAVSLAPDIAVTHNNLGNVLMDSGRLAEARAAFEKAIALDPGFATARSSLSQLLILEGDFEAGWEGLRWAFEARVRQWYGVPLPEYDGRELASGGVVLWGDWGIGDQVMFLRFLSTLQARVPQLVCICDKRLVRLLDRSFEEITFHPPIDPMDVRVRFPWVTHHLPVCDLGRVFKVDSAALEPAGRFLKADEAKVSEFGQRYRDGGADRLIGIAWRGGGKAETRALRSIPLVRWTSILKSPGCRFVSLQRGDYQAEIAEVSRAAGVEIIVDAAVDQMQDLDGFTAQIAAIDLVVSVDCTTVHLAGALAVPTLLLLPKVPDWRWGMEGTTTPWYESLRLLRQEHLHEWGAPLEWARQLLHGSVNR